MFSHHLQQTNKHVYYVCVCTYVLYIPQLKTSCLVQNQADARGVVIIDFGRGINT